VICSVSTEGRPVFDIVKLPLDGATLSCHKDQAEASVLPLAPALTETEPTEFDMADTLDITGALPLKGNVSMHTVAA
jgi:hypothetical protein